MIRTRELDDTVALKEQELGHVLVTSEENLMAMSEKMNLERGFQQDLSLQHDPNHAAVECESAVERHNIYLFIY